MEIFNDLLYSKDSVAHTIFTISLVAFFGLLLGKLKFRGIGLGIGGVMFAGIAVAAFGISVNHEIIEFLRDFGLVLFVYMIGLQVGPSFLSALRSHGVSLSIFALVVAVLGTLIAAGFVLSGLVPLSAAAGLLSGATTNTPSLGAAKEALASLPAVKAAVDPTLGYAISYPMGILGTILIVTFAKHSFKTTPEEAELKLRAEQDGKVKKISSITLVVENENLFDLPIEEIPGGKDLGIVISRLSRNGRIQVPTHDTKLKQSDIFMAVGEERALKAFALIVGHVADHDLTEIASELTIRSLTVTSPKVVGKTLSVIQANEDSQLTITRVRRGDVEFAATEDVHLYFGDKVTVVGNAEAVQRLSIRLGDSQQQLQHFQFFPVFVGIVIGVILGSIKWPIPFLTAPLKLGLAGGPLLASLFMSRFANEPKFSTYVPYGANLALRELGIVLFLACVGLKAGEQFFKILFSTTGLTWVLAGTVITLVPLATLLFLTSRGPRKINYLTFTGLCAGSMTDPPALAFATSLAPSSNAPAVAYATVYPLVMLLRILFAQVLVLALGAIPFVK